MRIHALTLACCLLSPLASAAPLQLMLGGEAITVEAPEGWANLKVTLADPSGRIIERSYQAQGNSLLDLGLSDLINGHWRYRLNFAGERVEAAAGSSEAADGRRTAPGRAWPALDGQFGVAAGSLVAPRLEAPPPELLDQVINDDLIVTGGICTGFDCVDGEDFNFISLKLKENNVRLHFEDTSAAGAFPGDDWSLLINDITSGGANKFSIENRTAATVPFSVIGAAPTNSLFIDATGRVGFRTPTPAVDLHAQTGNSPTLRLDQSAASGFTAQVWDVAGNEANFFVRDVTNGARLPLRIRPGAPTSSIDVSADGNVGFGGAGAAARVEARSSTPLNTPIPMLRVHNGSAGSGVQDRFNVDSSGNVTARGTISQLSSRVTKENIEPLEGALLLAKLERLEVPAWNYREATSEERHIGPMAEDFHATFGVGSDPRFLAPGDVAGVALASVKALQDEVKQRDARISELEARLQRLEALLVEPR